MNTIPLSNVGTLTDSTPVYEGVENYQPQDPPIATSEEDHIKTAICPAYVPTMHQYQPPTDDTYEYVIL